MNRLLHTTSLPSLSPLPSTTLSHPSLIPLTSLSSGGSLGGSRGLLPVTAAVSRRYFVVELLDPQLNFLDVKNHASLIVVSGRSSLEGQKDTDAILARTYTHIAPHSNHHAANGQYVSTIPSCIFSRLDTLPSLMPLTYSCTGFCSDSFSL